MIVTVRQGRPGADGQSAYELAVAAGIPGTEAEWLTSLHGADGVGIVSGAQAPLSVGVDGLLTPRRVSQCGVSGPPSVQVRVRVPREL